MSQDIEYQTIHTVPQQIIGHGGVLAVVDTVHLLIQTELLAVASKLCG